MNTYHKQSYIEAQSKIIQDLDSIPFDAYDILFVASNWDSRCISMTKIENLTASHALMLMYDVSDTQGRQNSHDEIIKTYLDLHCNEVNQIRHSSLDIENLWRHLYEYTFSIYLKKKRPLKIFFDLSAFPRYCSLALLAKSIPDGIAENITYFYAEGIYEHETDNKPYEFHKGKWKAIPIDGLEGKYDVDKNKYYLISIGFEGSQTARVVALDEPDRISILFPEPAVSDCYIEKTKKENQDLINEYLVPDSQILKATAGDAVEAWKKLEEAKLEEYHKPQSTDEIYENSEELIIPTDTNKNEEPNIFYLCCGTKPHALALALRALVLKSPTVLYYVPDEHVETDVKPSGMFWIYDIKDLSALPIHKEKSD